MSGYSYHFRFCHPIDSYYYTRCPKCGNTTFSISCKNDEDIGELYCVGCGWKGKLNWSIPDTDPYKLKNNST